MLNILFLFVSKETKRSKSSFRISMNVSSKLFKKKKNFDVKKKVKEGVGLIY